MIASHFGSVDLISLAGDPRMDISVKDCQKGSHAPQLDDIMWSAICIQYSSLLKLHLLILTL